MSGVVHNARCFVDAECDEDVLDRGKRDSDDLFSSAGPTPDSDATAEDALYGSSLEQRHCWAFWVMQLVLSDYVRFTMM